jgi:quinol monooxygenase YgiN
MSDGFAGIVTVKLKPGMAEQFIAIAREVGDAMSKEKEFERAWVHTRADDPDIIVVYEAWSCTYDYFMKELRNKPYRDRFEAEIGNMATAERKIEILNYAISYPG